MPITLTSQWENPEGRWVCDSGWWGPVPSGVGLPCGYTVSASKPQGGGVGSGEELGAAHTLQVAKLCEIPLG